MAKTTEVLERLKAGVLAVYDSEEWKKYLLFSRKFHHYSARNSLLIMMQRPDAELVAPYSTWQKVKRYVKRGAESIKIIAPHTYEEKDETGHVHTYIGYHVAHVFDVADTGSVDGSELPCICHRLDADLADNCCGHHLLRILEMISPVPITYKPLDNNLNGYYHREDREIVINKNLRELHMAKTLLHEIAHSTIHCIGGEEEKQDKETREIEAEAIAFCVCDWLGLDTSAYSFPYIATYAQGRDIAQLIYALDVIKRVSDEMIATIEDRLRELTDV